MDRNKGFTLIELMIVVGIIAILAALAIDSYRQYTVRARVTEVVNMAGRDKNAVSEFFGSQGTMPTAAQAGFELSASQSIYLTADTSVSGAGTNTGVITYTVGNLGSPDAQGTILMTGTGSSNGVSWICSAGTIPVFYLPAACR